MTAEEGGGFDTAIKGGPFSNKIFYANFSQSLAFEQSSERDRLGKKKKKISLCLVEIYKEEHAESMAATDRQLIWPLCFA